MLLAECWRWGADEAAVRALLPAADAALAWIDEYGDRDGDGFIEYQRATDRGLINQGWKDSLDGDQRRRRAASPSRRSRCARCRATRTPRCWPGPSWPRRSATRRRPRGCGSGPKRCAAVPRGVLAARKGLVCHRAGRQQTSRRRADQQRRRTACGPGIATDEHAGRADRAARRSRDGQRVRAAHPGHDDGRLQPDELPQRFGVAARHRDRGGRPAALPAHAGRGGSWPTGSPTACWMRRTRSTGGCPSCTAASRDRSSARRCPTRRRARRRRGPAPRRCCSCARFSA